MSLQKYVVEIDEEIPQAPKAHAGSSLLMMVGLPGSGKSSIVDRLRDRFPFVVISTDGIRAHLRRNPVYTAEEMALVYDICYAVIRKRLQRGQRVVFDASNYLAARRKRVITLAEGCGAPVAICVVQAAQDTIRERLLQRMSGNRHENDQSDADWSVYKWMVEAQEPVTEPHIVLDTTATPPVELADTLYEYWLQVEDRAQGNPDLQSPGWAGQFSRDD